MIGVRVVWTADGEVLKDDTVPWEGAILRMVDTVKIQAPGGPAVDLEVTFEFDQALVPRSAA